MSPFVTLHDRPLCLVWPVKLAILFRPSKLVPSSWVLAPKVEPLLFGRSRQVFKNLLDSREIKFANPSYMRGSVEIAIRSRNVVLLYLEPHATVGNDVAGDVVLIALR